MIINKLFNFFRNIMIPEFAINGKDFGVPPGYYYAMGNGSIYNSLFYCDGIYWFEVFGGEMKNSQPRLVKAGRGLKLYLIKKAKKKSLNIKFKIETKTYDPKYWYTCFPKEGLLTGGKWAESDYPCPVCKTSMAARCVCRKCGWKSIEYKPSLND